MNTPEKSGEREIAARIIVETLKVDKAINEALSLLNNPSAEVLASCEASLASTASLREMFADWMFDPSKHCHSCFKVANIVADTCHADSHLCRECLIGEHDPKAIAFFLQD